MSDEQPETPLQAIHFPQTEQCEAVRFEIVNGDLLWRRRRDVELPPAHDRLVME